jgi:hypothetical protein
MGLQEKLLETRQNFEASAPAEAVATIHRAIQVLLDSGIMEHVLKVGDRLPGFELPDQHGQRVRSEDIVKQGPVALYFYRGVW